MAEQTLEDLMQWHKHTQANIESAKKLKVGDLVILSFNGNAVNHHCGDQGNYMLWSVLDIGTQGVLLSVDTVDVQMQALVNYRGLFDLWLSCAAGEGDRNDCNTYEGNEQAAIWTLNTDY